MAMLMIKFLKILRIEMEDLEGDIELLIEENYQRLRKHTETERVCLENVATLHSEEFGIHHFIAIIDRLDVDDYDNLDHLIASLRAEFRDVVKRCGLVRATLCFADRKIDKVQRYVTQHGDIVCPVP